MGMYIIIICNFIDRLRYTPHISLSALAVALFSILLIFHCFRLYTTRLYAFSILIIFTTLCEIIGYTFRLRSSPPPIGDPYNVINFVVQYFFIVCAPVFLSAAIYTTLTSLITIHGLLGLSKKKILTIFITSDVIATIIQVAGAALIGVSESNRKSPHTGNNILLAGLAFQVFSFLIFLMLLIIFLRNARKVTEFTSALVTSSFLVYLRTCFRLAETSQGVMGYASSHEVFFGSLEFGPIVLAVALLAWWHPGMLRTNEISAFND